jgi:hypothetical protein
LIGQIDHLLDLLTDIMAVVAMIVLMKPPIP